MTEYTVALKYVVDSRVGDPAKHADKVAAALARAERESARAAQRAERMQHRLNAEAVRSAQRMEDAKRNAAFRRLMAVQRAEERAAAVRGRLQQREIAAAQRAERMATARAGARGRGVGAAAQSALGFVGGGVKTAVGGMLAGGAYAGYKALDTAQYIEGARNRLTAQLGNRKDANTEIRDALRIAEKTIFDPDEVIDATAKLAINFKDAASRRYILGAVSDFATATGEGNEGLQRSIRAISQIAGKGKLQQEELTGQLGELGLSATKVYEKLATSLGIKGKTEQEKRDKVLKAITAGKVDSNRAIQAITDVMRAEKPAGETAAGSAGTLSSQLSNIQKGLFTLYAAADIEQWPAMVALKELLKDISGFFSVDSAAGQDFMLTLREVTAKVGVPLIESMRRALKSLTDSFSASPRDLELFVRGLMDIGKTLFEIGTAFAWASAKLVELLGYLNELEGEADLPIFDWPDKMRQLGSDMVTGLWEGIKSAAAAPMTAAEYLADRVVETMRSKLQSHSPSRVTMALGGDTAAGYALGIERNTARVTRAAGLLPEAATSAMSPRAYPAGGTSGAGSGARPALSFSFTLPVVTSQNPADLTRQAMPMIMAQLEPQLGRYFGRQLAQGAG